MNKKIFICTTLITLSLFMLIASISLIRIDYFNLKLEKVKNKVKVHDFITLMIEDAQDGYKKYNILPSLTMAQGILESNWGNSKLAIEGKNLFGMKAGQKDNKIILQTFEYSEGKKIKRQGAFKTYSTFKDSIMDHNSLLGEYKRYEQVRLAKNYKEGAIALYECGYATDPYYPQKIIAIIEQYKLYEYDIKEEKKENTNKISSLDRMILTLMEKIKK